MDLSSRISGGTYFWSVEVVFQLPFTISLCLQGCAMYECMKRKLFRGGCISSLIHSLCHRRLTSPSHQPSQLTYLRTPLSFHPPLTISPGTIENAFKRSSLFCITAGLNRKGAAEFLCAFCVFICQKSCCWVNLCFLLSNI